MTKKWLFWVCTTLLVTLMLRQALNQPGVEDLSSGFVEVASYRSENNTGPVIRRYVVTTLNTENQEEMEAYGNLMPFTKLGETKVYFFESGQPYPQQIYAGTSPFSIDFEPYCIALYEKSFQGQRLLISPFNAD